MHDAVASSLDALGSDARKAYEKFYFQLAAHSSWLPRRVDRWSYVGGGQWRRDISYDLNFKVIAKYLESAGLKKSDMEGDVECAQDGRVFAMPFLEIEKCVHFSDFDLCDCSGKSMHLLADSITAKYCLFALIEAVNEERRTNNLGRGHSLEKKYWLQKFMSEWFLNSCPKDGKGNYLTLNSADSFNIVVKSMFAELAVRKAMADEELIRCSWGEAVKQGRNKVFQDLEIDLRYFIANSRVFRYFAKRYAIMRLLFVRLDLERREHSMVKCRYESTCDLFPGSVSESGEVRRLPLSPWAYFEPDIDGASMAESNCVTLMAPDGMCFASPPNADGERFVIVNSSPSGRELEAKGTFTPRCVTIHAKNKWQKDNKYPERRMPLWGNVESDYRLRVACLPDLGKRLVGYLVLFMLSLLVLISAAWGHLQLFDQGHPSVSVFVGLVPVATLYLATHDEASYMRRRSLLFPTTLSLLCLVIDYFTFVCELFGCSIAQWAYIPVVALFALLMAWLCYVAFRRRYWEEYFSGKRKQVSREFKVKTTRA